MNIFKKTSLLLGAVILASATLPVNQVQAGYAGEVSIVRRNSHHAMYYDDLFQGAYASMEVFDPTGEGIYYHHQTFDYIYNQNYVSPHNSNIFMLRKSGSVSETHPNGLCVNAPTTLSNDGRLNLWNCSRTNRNQQWLRVPKSSGTYMIQRYNSDYCLNSHQYSTGEVRLNVWRCDQADTEQRFYIFDNGVF